MEELHVSINELTPELKDMLDKYDQLDLVVELDDEEIEELNLQAELNELEL